MPKRVCTLEPPRHPMASTTTVAANSARVVSVTQKVNEQIAKLAGALQRRTCSDKEAIITQGEPGYHFYIVDDGECVATIKNGQQDQEVMRYHQGELFGEKALLENAPRGATVTAVGDVSIWALSRTDFENKLGPLSQLKAEQYLADPRKLISDYYQNGDTRGPAGTF